MREKKHKNIKIKRKKACKILKEKTHLFIKPNVLAINLVFLADKIVHDCIKCFLKKLLTFMD